MTPPPTDGHVYSFDDFVLDTDNEELRRGEEPLTMEPQVFRLLLLLVESEGRLISRDELIEKIWNGRVVSDSAISSRIKTLRRLLGDDGKEQRLLRTVPKRGFRFVAAVVRQQPSVPHVRAAEPAPVATSEAMIRPSIAVLPFAALTGDADASLIALAVPDELITELARLRWLFIIARGSSFRFRSLDADPAAIRRELGVRYCLSGSVEVGASRVALSIELTDLHDSSVIWSERYGGDMSELGSLREGIKLAVVAALEIEIPAHEATMARLADPSSLSTWSNYHLGLQHLNRFTAEEIHRACGYFTQALEQEPEFSRAHSALSAAHFQIAFQRLSEDQSGHRNLARIHAERGLALDAQDPFAHFVMGRVHWLEDAVAASQSWLRRAVELSPSSARSHYALAWSSSILGAHHESADEVQLALELSPLDPFRYGMLGVRAFNCLWSGDTAAAARWAEEAASAPGAHALIALIATACLDLVGNREGAQRWAGRARLRHPGVNVQLFLQAFPIAEQQLREQLASSLARYGF